MKEIETFSYFKRGVTNVIPLMEVSLGAVFGLIRSTRLKEVTANIRKGVADKTKDLPSACFSGTFKSRGLAGLIQYSGLICLDVDELDFAQSLKERLSKDAFLNPVLVFISPRGRGLKIIIRIRNAVAEKHGLYFDLLACYIKAVYGVEIDGSGRDISRLCFICHDPEPFFFEDGFVTADDLLKLQPGRDAKSCVSTPTPDRCENRTPATAYLDAIREKKNKSYNRDAPPCVSTSDQPSSLLNGMDSVHSLAVDALIRNGWQQKTDILWTRPGKPVKEGHSAKYSIYGPDGIYFLRNFSSSAPHFALDKSYTDVGIISELDYGGDFKKCISELANRFLAPN